MKVAAKIVPCPISEAIIEVRFNTTYDEAAVFGVIYNKLIPEFTKTLDLPVLQLPASLRKNDPALLFQPYYRLERKDNPNALIQIGPRVFSVILTGDYPGWGVYIKQALYGLQKLEESGVVTEINRFGLRYLNFIDDNVLLKSHLAIKLEDKSFNSFNTQLRIEIPDGVFVSALAINNSVAIQNQKNPTNIKLGSLVDIDTFVNKPLPNFFAEKTKWLEEGHATEKKLFFSLLNDEYVKTLKEVTYA